MVVKESKLSGALETKIFNSCRQLLLFDLSVAFNFSFSSQALPGKFSFDKIQQNVGKTLQVVSSALLDQVVGVCGGESSCPHKRCSLGALNMLLGQGVDESLGQTEVHNVNDLSLLIVFYAPHHLSRIRRNVLNRPRLGLKHEVLWLEVSVQKAQIVHEFQARKLNLDSKVPFSLPTTL